MTNLVDSLREQVVSLKLANQFGNLPAWVLTDLIEVVEPYLRRSVELDQATYGRISEPHPTVRMWREQTGRTIQVEDVELKEEYVKYLNELRDSGVSNMFGAVPWLMSVFSELDRHTAKIVLAKWMRLVESQDRPYYKRGVQIAYLPPEADGDLEHKGVRFGFVVAMSGKGAFCRFWRNDAPGVLGAEAHSELMPFDNLRAVDKVDQGIVDFALANLGI